MPGDEESRSLLANIFKRVDQLGDAIERIDDNIHSLRAEVQECCRKESCRAQECRADDGGGRRFGFESRFR
jgi:hypothetical protein